MRGILLFTIFLGVGVIASAQKSGIKGQLYWLSPQTNFNPDQQNIPYSGIPLEVFVHQLTTTAEIDTLDGAIKKIYTPLVSRFFAKSNGSFKIKLPPGSYSVFVRYKNDFFGNLLDSHGNLSPVVVMDKNYSWITITIDYSSYH